MKYDMEQLLQQALSPEAEPDFWLNQQILQKAKEKKSMKNKRKRFSVAAAAMVFMLCTASLGVVAAVRYLTAEQVAESFSDELLSKAFHSEEAILVNEAQEYAGYRVTLLGIVSGEGLSDYSEWDEQGKIQNDKTYIVTAIENSDGTPMPDVSDEAYGEDSFYVSPYIKGLSMNEYNAHTLGGGYSEDVIDGIQYRIMECDNIEMFAGRGLYLGVSDGSFFNAAAYEMKQETGEITRNQDYEGMNALFELPIPKESGDEKAVEEYLKEKEDELENEEVEKELSTVENINEAIESWTLADFEANAECVYEEELVIDEKDCISYAYESEKGNNFKATLAVRMLFMERVPGLSKYSTVYGSKPTFIETYEFLENGNIKLRVFAYEG